MLKPLVYLNGKFLPFDEAGLLLNDAGFVSGATVVDNARTFRHKLFHWSDHLSRFRRDCTTCYVPLMATDEQLTATAEELVARNAKLLPPGGELQLVTFATPGPLGFYVGESATGPPTIGMVTYPLPFARYRTFFTEGVTLAVTGYQGVHSETIVPATVKHRSRMAWHIADHRARGRTGNAAALGIPLSSRDGSLTETSVGNLLIVIDGTVLTPPRELILDGISQKVTQDLCLDCGIPFAEAPLPVSPALAGREALLTGTAFSLAGVRELWAEHGERVQFRWPGPIFRRLLAAWSRLVAIDVEKQFLEADA